jgi:neutral ceramidase
MSFQISTGKVDITPTSGQNPYMAGYGVQSALRTVERDAPYAEPLYARCVIFWDDGRPHAVVSLDVLGIPRSVHQALRPRLVALTNWSSSRIVLVATHTHNGPVIGDTLDPFITYDLIDLSVVSRYTEWLKDKVVTLVRDTLSASRTTVTLEHRSTTMNFSRNRAGLPTVETAVPVITARRRNGSLAAVLFSYGSHPVSAGWQEIWDGDWPAGACTVVENQTGAFPLFLPGAAGDQDPLGVRGWQLRDTHSGDLGRAVVAAANTLGRSLPGPITSSIGEATLPLEITPTAPNISAVRSAFVTRMENPLGQPATYQRHAEMMITRIDSGSYKLSVLNPSQVWRIGGSPVLKMAFVGGELVSGYAAYFRARHGGVNGLYIGGYANEVECYVPADSHLPPLAPSWGSYEGGWDSDYPGIAGGSMTVYPHIARFRAGSNGVETALISTVSAQLS